MLLRDYLLRNQLDQDLVNYLNSLIQIDFASGPGLLPVRDRRNFLVLGGLDLIWVLLRHAASISDLLSLLAHILQAADQVFGVLVADCHRMVNKLLPHFRHLFAVELQILHRELV